MIFKSLKDEEGPIKWARGGVGKGGEKAFLARDRTCAAEESEEATSNTGALEQHRG